jgi:hypothetical protein
MRLLGFPAGSPGGSSRGARGGRRRFAYGHRRLFQAVVIAGVLTILGSATAAAGSTPRPLTRASWGHAIKQLALPGRGCFTASYPAVSWRKTTCVTAPNIPYRPFQPSPAVRPIRRVTAPEIVGNGVDYSAQVSGAPMTSATGSFDSGTVVTSVGSFSLQLNSSFFASPTCSGALIPADCLGWQQFIYSSSFDEVFMQYWLIYYDTTCPTGWHPYGSDCWENSTATTLTGGPLTASNLASATLTGTAASGGNDTVSLVDGSLAAGVSNTDSVVDLSAYWTTAEFAAVGDGGGSEAMFGSGSTLTVRTAVDNGSTAAPTCVLEGFTAETNNLNLAPTPTFTAGTNPAIESLQNSAGGTPSCATAHSDGDTHEMTFQNLFYDFQAQGDHELTSASSGFLVENRQVSGAPSWPNAAVNQAIAAQVGSSDVAVCATTSSPLYVNGQATALSPGSQLSLPGGASVSLDPTGTTYLIEDASGDSVSAAVSTTTSPKYINATVGLGTWPESVQGLLANASGSTNPTAIETSTGTVLTAPYNFSEFYGVYGKSWQVGATGQQDLLTPCGPAPIASDPNDIFDGGDLPPAIDQQAQTDCEDDGVTAATLLAACTIDEAVLGTSAPVVYETLPTGDTDGQISSNCTPPSVPADKDRPDKSLTGTYTAFPDPSGKLINGVGAQTTQDVYGALTQGYAYNGSTYTADCFGAQVGSWNAINPNTGDTYDDITPFPGSDTFARPDGSGDGQNALSAAWNPGNDTFVENGSAQTLSGSATVKEEEISFARSTSLPAQTLWTQNGQPNDLTFIPQAIDAVGVAEATFGSGTTVGNFNTGALTAIYNGGTYIQNAGQNTVGDVIETGGYPFVVTAVSRAGSIASSEQVVPVLPQQSSGIRSFFLSAIGASPFNANVVANETGAAAQEENNPENDLSTTNINAALSLNSANYTVPSTGIAIVPMSGAQLIEQEHGFDTNTLGTSSFPTINADTLWNGQTGIAAGIGTLQTAQPPQITYGASLVGDFACYDWAVIPSSFAQNSAAFTDLAQWLTTTVPAQTQVWEDFGFDPVGSAISGNSANWVTTNWLN